MTANRTAPQALVSATARFVAAVLVATGFALVSLGAASASHDAVQIADGRFSAPNLAHVTLPRVEIVVRRAGAGNTI
ncbi:MAG: hypothetical protein HY854_10310 [Burkholderiales bacterium]|nr:hypothetical protein [Burkholderiales bacterium]